MKAFEINYTKKVGGLGTILVKSIDEKSALNNAAQLCFTGRDFKISREISLDDYIKPSKQGFTGSHRM